LKNVVLNFLPIQCITQNIFNVKFIAIYRTPVRKDKVDKAEKQQVELSLNFLNEAKVLFNFLSVVEITNYRFDTEFLGRLFETLNETKVACLRLCGITLTDTQPPENKIIEVLCKPRIVHVSLGVVKGITSAMKFTELMKSHKGEKKGLAYLYIELISILASEHYKKVEKNVKEIKRLLGLKHFALKVVSNTSCPIPFGDSKETQHDCAIKRPDNEL